MEYKGTSPVAAGVTVIANAMVKISFLICLTIWSCYGRRDKKEQAKRNEG